MNYLGSKWPNRLKLCLFWLQTPEAKTQSQCESVPESSMFRSVTTQWQEREREEVTHLSASVRHDPTCDTSNSFCLVGLSTSVLVLFSWCNSVSLTLTHTLNSSLCIFQGSNPGDWPFIQNNAESIADKNWNHFVVVAVKRSGNVQRWTTSGGRADQLTSDLRLL